MKAALLPRFVRSNVERLSARSVDGRLRVVCLFGNRDSAEAWEIGDFLKRSVVEFDWVELIGDDCQRALGLPRLGNVRLPVVELPEAMRESW